MSVAAYSVLAAAATVTAAAAAVLCITVVLGRLFRLCTTQESCSRPSVTRRPQCGAVCGRQETVWPSTRTATPALSVSTINTCSSSLKQATCRNQPLVNAMPSVGQLSETYTLLWASQATNTD